MAAAAVGLGAAPGLLGDGGDAAPEAPAALDAAAVYAALSAACGGGGGAAGAGRREAEAALRHWEETGHPGFAAALVEVATAAGGAADVPEELRLLAAVVLKNVAGSSVRKVVGTREWSRVAPDEAAFVRQRLEQRVLGEASERVGTQLALAVANVARIDYPERWPGVLAHLLGAARWAAPTAPEVKLRALVALKHVGEAVAGKTAFVRARIMSRGYGVFASAGDEDTPLAPHQAARELFPALAAEWHEHASAAEHAGGEEAAVRAGFACRCVRALRPLFAALLSLDEAGTGGVDVGGLFGAFLHHISAVGESAPPIALKHRRLLAECAVLALDCAPLDFAQFLGPYVRCFMSGVLALRTDALADDPKWALVLTRFLSRALLCPHFDLARAADLERDAREADADTQELLSPAAARSRAAATAASAAFAPLFETPVVVHALVSRYFILTTGELEEWQSDPEALFRAGVENAGASADVDSPRPCAELLLSCLLLREPQFVTGAVLNLAAQAQQQSDALVRDACYRAVGVLAPDLPDGSVDFQSWYASELEPLLQHAMEGVSVLHTRILRARALWLIGCFHRQLSPGLYERCVATILPFVSPDDPLVALHAVQSLWKVFAVAVSSEEEGSALTAKALIDAAAPEVMRRCFVLARGLGEPEGVIQVLYLIARLVELMGRESLAPHLADLASALPPLWNAISARAQETGADVRLHSVLLTVFTHVVETLGTDALAHTSVCEVLFPLLDHATTVGSSLFDDGLKLWLAAIRACAQISEPLMARFPHLVSVLRVEHHRIAMLLVQGYILIGGAPFVEANMGICADIVNAAVLDCKNRPPTEVLAAGVIAELLLQVAPAAAIPALMPSMQHAVATLVASKPTTTPDGRIIAEGPPLHAGIARAFTVILGRAALANPQCISALGDTATLTHAVQAWAGCATARTIEELMRRATPDVDRQAAALGVLALLASGEPAALGALPAIVRLTLRAVEDLRGEPHVPVPSPPEVPQGQLPNQIEISAHALQTRDPVHTLNVPEMARATFSRLSEEALSATMKELTPSMARVFELLMAP